VAELGYVFRDLPWKTLDLFTEKTADAGLLDVFSITDEPAMTAGRVNLNTQQAPVLQSILAGTIWDERSSSTVTMSGVSAQSADYSGQHHVGNFNQLSNQQIFDKLPPQGCPRQFCPQRHPIHLTTIKPSRLGGKLSHGQFLPFPKRASGIC